MQEFFNARNWSLYPFLSPALALLIFFLLDPFHDRLLGRKLKSYLKTNNREDLFPIVDGIAHDYALQVSWVATLASFAASFVAFEQVRKPSVLIVATLLLIIVGLPATIDLFIRSPGFHSTTKIGRSRLLRFMASWEWTRIKVYSILIALLNVGLIVLTALTLPKKVGP